MYDRRIPLGIEAHSVHRRASDYSDEVMNDGAAPDYAADDNDVNEDEPDPHAVITSKPENFTVVIGSRVRLDCQISPAEAAKYIVVQWIKGADVGLFLNKIPQSNRHDKYETDTKSNALIINDVNVDDTDSYTCTILQDEKVNVTHKLHVTVPPMIHSTETTTVENVIEPVTDDDSPRIVSFTVSDNEPKEGESVVFTCETSGTPKPSVLWSRRRNGETSTETLAEANGKFEGQRFIMPNVTKNDSGVYFCYAVNDVGNATAQTVTLNVFSKPHVHAHMTVVNSDIGVEAVLKCSTHDGLHQISWYKDGRRIHTGANFVVDQAEDMSESTLTVIPKTDEDFGTFTCEASNRVGKHSRSIELTNLPVIEGVDFEGRKLTFTIHSHQPLQKIQINLREHGQDGSRLLEVPVPEETKQHMQEIIYVFDEEIQGKYEMRLQAENTKGWSQFTEPINIDFDVDAQPQKIQTASVLGTGSGANTVLSSPLFILNTIMMYLLVRTL
ncbi:immunoglobulin i-set domain-containing protein [Phthorimaea operculella]|nr:immunoglobulin i-set domain-containing protein [Phthorimaea operculella]